jgi:hypothetical protein
MKKLFILFALTASTMSFATETDGVPVLGATYTDVQEEMVRTGAKNFCAGIEEFEVKEQCAMDYYAQHNYQGEPDCE